MSNPFDNLFEQAANITKAHAYDILVKQVEELQAEITNLKNNAKTNQNNACALALEFGYKQCEKGENLQAAFLNYNKIVTQ